MRSRCSRAERVGGVIRTSPFAGHPAIDEGADAFLARVPWAVDLARKRVARRLVDIPAAARAAVWWDGLHDIPEGLLLGVPTGVVGLARSSLLSRRGKARAATEVVRRRSDPRLTRSVRTCVRGSATRSTSVWSTR